MDHHDRLAALTDVTRFLPPRVTGGKVRAFLRVGCDSVVLDRAFTPPIGIYALWWGQDLSDQVCLSPPEVELGKVPLPGKFDAKNTPRGPSASLYRVATTLRHFLAYLEDARKVFFEVRDGEDKVVGFASCQDLGRIVTEGSIPRTAVPIYDLKALPVGHLTVWMALEPCQNDEAVYHPSVVSKKPAPEGLRDNFKDENEETYPDETVSNVQTIQKKLPHEEDNNQEKVQPSTVGKTRVTESTCSGAGRPTRKGSKGVTFTEKAAAESIVFDSDMDLVDEQKFDGTNLDQVLNSRTKSSEHSEYGEGQQQCRQKGSPSNLGRGSKQVGGLKRKPLLVQRNLAKTGRPAKPAKAVVDPPKTIVTINRKEKTKADDKGIIPSILGNSSGERENQDPNLNGPGPTRGSVPKQPKLSWNLSISKLKHLAAVNQVRVRVDNVTLKPDVSDVVADCCHGRMVGQRAWNAAKLKPRGSQRGSAFYCLTFKVPPDEESTSICNSKVKEGPRRHLDRDRNLLHFGGSESVHPVRFTPDLLDTWWASDLQFDLFSRRLNQRTPVQVGKASIGLKYLLIGSSSPDTEKQRPGEWVKLNLSLFASCALINHSRQSREQELPEIIGNLTLSYRMEAAIRKPVHAPSSNSFEVPEREEQIVVELEKELEDESSGAVREPRQGSKLENTGICSPLEGPPALERDSGDSSEERTRQSCKVENQYEMPMDVPISPRKTTAATAIDNEPLKHFAATSGGGVEKGVNVSLGDENSSSDASRSNCATCWNKEVLKGFTGLLRVSKGRDFRLQEGSSNFLQASVKVLDGAGEVVRSDKFFLDPLSGAIDFNLDVAVSEVQLAEFLAGPRGTPRPLVEVEVWHSKAGQRLQVLAGSSSSTASAANGNLLAPLVKTLDADPTKRRSLETLDFPAVILNDWLELKKRGREGVAGKVQVFFAIGTEQQIRRLMTTAPQEAAGIKLQGQPNGFSHDHRHHLIGRQQDPTTTVGLVLAVEEGRNLPRVTAWLPRGSTTYRDVTADRQEMGFEGCLPCTFVSVVPPDLERASSTPPLPSSMFRISSPLVPYESNPKWNFRTLINCPLDMLLDPRSRHLIVKVWLRGRVRAYEVESEDIGGSEDYVVGFVSVDLTLLPRMPDLCLNGWYNVRDFIGRCKGQVKLTVRPNLERNGSKELARAFGLLHPDRSSRSDSSLSSASTVIMKEPSRVAGQDEKSPKSESRLAPLRLLTDDQLNKSVLQQKMSDLSLMTRRLKAQLEVDVDCNKHYDVHSLVTPSELVKGKGVNGSSSFVNASSQQGAQGRPSEDAFNEEDIFGGGDSVIENSSSILLPATLGGEATEPAEVLPDLGEIDWNLVLNSLKRKNSETLSEERRSRMEPDGGNPSLMMGLDKK